jgi:hypothetical protein
MILTDPIIFTKPLHIWLGLLAFLLLLLQISVGLRIIKLPFWVHQKLIWWILLLVVLVHGFYGFEIYFLK